MGTLLQLYCVIGALFGLFFVIRGYSMLQPDAKGSPIRFRLLLFPACLVLWPYLLVRIVSGKTTTAD